MTRPANLQQPLLARPVRVLFVTSSPSDLPKLSTGLELREIDESLRAAGCRDRFEIECVPELRPGELARAIQRHRPDVVHFCGHGAEGGELLLADEDGRATPASAETVARLFELLARDVPVRCVVLNACHSDELARALARHVDCVVGMREAVGNRAAVFFAGAFYEGVGFGRDVETSFELARLRVEERLPARRSTAALRHREGVDPRAVRLLDAPAPPAADALALLRERLPRPDEVDALRALLAGVGDGACRRACLAVDGDAPTDVTLARAVERLAGYSTAAPVPKLAAFALHAAAAAGGEARDALRAWAVGHASRHGGDPAAVEARWREVAAPSEPSHGLTVVLDDDGAGRFRLRAWLREGGAAARVTPLEAPPDPVAADELPPAVDDLLRADPVYALLVDAGGPRLLVEVIAPLEGIAASATRAFLEAPFALEHDVVIRWRERVYERVRRPPRAVRPGLWQRRWDRLRRGEGAWASTAPPDLAPSEVAFARDECAALAVAGGGPLRWLEGALHHGLPVAAWVADGDAGDGHRALIDSLVRAPPREALAHAIAARRGPSPHGRHLALLWDDPERLPPDAGRSALLAAPSRT